MKVVEWDKKENISKILIDLLEIDPKFSFDKEKDDIFFFCLLVSVRLFNIYPSSVFINRCFSRKLFIFL